MRVFEIEEASGLARQAWQELMNLKDKIGEPGLEIVSLRQFRELANATPTSDEQRLLIIQQAELLLRHLYAHAPFKDLEPALQRLQQMREWVGTPELTELNFHDQMARSMLELDDAHTLYGRPAPFRDAFAFLPFQLKHFVDKAGVHRYIVSKVMPNFRHRFLKPGSEIIAWGKAIHHSLEVELEPIEKVVTLSSLADLGPNQSAALGFGLRRLHLRQLTYKAGPTCDRVAFQYVDRNRSTARTMIVPWGVALGGSPAALMDSSGGSCSDETARSGRASMMLFRPDKCAYEHQMALNADKSDFVAQEWESKFPKIFEFQFSGGPQIDELLDPTKLSPPSATGKSFGYIRIKNFDLGHDGEFGREDRIAEEFQRILEIQMERAPDGLILDLRGNPGGNVKAAEYLLQMLTPRPIQAAQFHWIRNEEIRKTLATLKEVADRNRDGALNEAEQRIFDMLLPQFGPWLEDLQHWEEDERSEETRLLSRGRTWSDHGEVNAIGQVYQGPVLLLVDGFTYSAADIFSGGFQDHQIGPVLGLDKSTGGGGAMVKQHGEILPFAPLVGLDLQPLPAGVTLSVAVLRSARLDGSFIEGVGVPTDKQFKRQRNDVLRGNPGVLAKACEELARRPSYRLKIESVEPTDTGMALKVSQRGFSTLKVFLDGEPVEASIGENGLLEISSEFARVVDQTVLLQGLDEKGNVVVSTRKLVEKF
jgi:hypothetical protein